MAQYGINSHMTAVLILDDSAAFMSEDNLRQSAAQCCRCVSLQPRALRRPGGNFFMQVFTFSLQTPRLLSTITLDDFFSQSPKSNGTDLIGAAQQPPSTHLQSLQRSVQQSIRSYVFITLNESLKQTKIE